MFLQLIWKFLKAGYMEQWMYNRTYSVVPQGAGVSPVLAQPIIPAGSGPLSAGTPLKVFLI